MFSTFNKYKALFAFSALALLGLSTIPSEDIVVSSVLDKKTSKLTSFALSGNITSELSVAISNGDKFISCNWGNSLMPVASVKTGPKKVSVTFFNQSGNPSKTVVVGDEWKLVSLFATDYTKDGSCDLIAIDTSGKVNLYVNPALSDEKRLLLSLPPSGYNYTLTRSMNDVVGFAYYGPGPRVGGKKGKKTNTGNTLTVTDLNGTITGHAYLPRSRLKKVLSLNDSTASKFAVVTDKNISIIDQNGTSFGSFDIDSGSAVFTRDAKGLGYSQVISINGNNITVIDPKLLSIETNNVNLVKSDQTSSNIPSPSTTSSCEALNSELSTAMLNGDFGRVQEILLTMSSMPECLTSGDGSDGIVGGGTNPFYTGGTFVPTPVTSAVVSDVLELRDNRLNGVGPCDEMKVPVDGYKQGFTLKNSDTRPGQIAMLVPSCFDIIGAQLMDSKTYERILGLKDNGCAFPDASGYRRLYRSKGSVRTFGGKTIMVKKLNGSMCYKIPKNKTRVD